MISRNNKLKASIGYYDPMFRNFLERGQNLRPELFTTGLSIGDFSLRKIPRRGETTDAENNNMDTVDIELINWCRKKGASKVTEAGLLMRQVYTQVSRAVAFSLCFSQSH